jgi:hypothetical protein
MYSEEESRCVVYFAIIGFRNVTPESMRIRPKRSTKQRHINEMRIRIQEEVQSRR